ncbi:cytochrome c oxidase accessory protein CcoG [Terasakiella sp.]|uniref:cytochrome c oxidase accessory protein CcoG n=1 Tax=Terasakiella sp. TaxID=2034861 RepID=UPI003AA8C12F
MQPMSPNSLSADTEAARGDLYASRQKVHPKAVKGFYRSLKNATLWGFLVLYHFTPLLPWAREGDKPDQAILFDIPGERIYLFNLEIWPQDIYILSALMIIAAIGLFVSATLIGRAWCGFACFQTVWTDLFMKVEAWIEGDRNARIRLDKAPNSMNKTIKRIAKHSVWLAISCFFALSFLWYFHDPLTITKDLFQANLTGWTLATFATMAGMTYMMAGFAREQVCFYMCPYGRFQGVMFDDHSKVITYQDWRGEGRAKPGKSRDFSDRGHCVDCSLCVQACPTGIDIRDGQQMECIGCGLCIDACDTVMQKFNLPTSLITYDSAYNIQQASKGEATQNPLLRPRVLVYFTILLVTIIAAIVSINMRAETTVSILRDRAPFFVKLSSGQIQNAYTIRLINKSTQDRNYTLHLIGLANPTVRIIGQKDDKLHLKAGEVGTFRMIVKSDLPGNTQARLPIHVQFSDPEKNDIQIAETLFIGPQH